VSERVDEEARPAHRAYARRQLHPLVLCSPFVYRTVQKPLGYAGDYEMVNMILRESLEGGSLFAKIVNMCFLNNPPAQAHRNRIKHLKQRLVEETRRAARAGRVAKVFNLGCGPAKEVQDFLSEEEISNRADLTLLDFNDETLRHVERLLTDRKSQSCRTTPIKLLKKSVHQLLKEAERGQDEMRPGTYDFIYCAGLFDYMSDRICKRLMNIFYDLLAPGGLLLATNVDACKPFRQSMEYLMEWHLNCRNGPQLKALEPEAAAPNSCSIKADATGVNVFIEVRKPENA
jgi:extracellular factor (EF) 3-hydroxypalmitic acid methyl ester biosynthesis protein